MDDGLTDLDEQLRRVRSLDGMVRDVAPAIATTARDEVVKLVRAGRSPDGEKLAPTKDGRVPLRNAERAIVARAIGDVVLVRVNGPEALHHQGRARGGVRRPLIPTVGIPGPMATAIKAVVDDEFLERMEGGRG